jgi:glycosyltransferase involved in cell wall biosynthesis
MPNPPWMQLVEAEPKQQNDHPVLLAVSRMYGRKRLELLLKAVDVVRRAYPDVELRLVGSGLEWEKLQQLSAALDLKRNVTFLGSVADDAAFARQWRQADVFCHASSQETFGYVYLEALRLGKAIVAPAAASAPEVLGDAALLAEPDSFESLAAQIMRFLADDKLRADYGLRARERSLRFPYEGMIARYAAKLEELAR